MIFAFPLRHVALVARSRVPHRARVSASACMLACIALLAACSSTPVRYGSERPYRPSASRERSAGQEEISIEAMGLVGIPYRWGGNTPRSGFDCSGLVRYVVKHAAGIELPRTTAEMSSVGEVIPSRDLASGDLVFFNTTGRAHSHVGIYVGKGQFVHAPSTGGTVRLSNIDLPYWSRRFDGVRRVAADRAPAETGVLLASPAPAATRVPAPTIARVSPEPEPAAQPTQPPASLEDAIPTDDTPLTATPPVATRGNADDPIAQFAN